MASTEQQRDASPDTLMDTAIERAVWGADPWLRALGLLGTGLLLPAVIVVWVVDARLGDIAAEGADLAAGGDAPILAVCLSGATLLAAGGIPSWIALLCIAASASIRRRDAEIARTVAPG